MYCEKCGSFINADMKYCTHCGEKIKKDEITKNNKAKKDNKGDIYALMCLIFELVYVSIIYLLLPNLAVEISTYVDNCLYIGNLIIFVFALIYGLFKFPDNKLLKFLLSMAIYYIISTILTSIYINWACNYITTHCE
jgi:hypothetical protein